MEWCSHARRLVTAVLMPPSLKFCTLPLLCPSPLPQVLEILSHANKRVRALPTLRLPLQELAELYAGARLGSSKGA